MCRIGVLMGKSGTLMHKNGVAVSMAVCKFDGSMHKIAGPVRKKYIFMCRKGRWNRAT